MKCPWCGDKECGYKESKLYWHEALHTSNLATDFFYDNVENHPAVQHDAELKAAAEKVTMAMAAFYQIVGHKSVDYDERIGAARKQPLQKAEVPCGQRELALLAEAHSMLDGAYDIIELWDTGGKPYNEKWKADWLNRAREKFGATSSI